MSAPQQAIPFPCYALMNNACNGGVVLNLNTGAVAMPLFTSEDKVNKFRAAQVATQKFAGPCIKFNWDHELYLYLKALPPSVTEIVVDPEQTQGTYLNFTVAGLKKQLQQSINDPNQR